MKTVIFLFLVSFTSVTAHAQLNNTHWKGTLHSNNNIDVVFNYGKDTLTVTNSADNSTIETMTYTIADGIISIKKIDGMSDCDKTVTGKYKFQIKDDLLYVTLLSDECKNRSENLENSKWTKSE